MVERYKSNVIRREEPPRPPDKRNRFPKGNRMGGRPKGSTNKLGKLVKDSMVGAIDKLGMLEPVYAVETRTDRDGVTRRFRTDRIIAWRPTGEGGAEGYLIWLGCNYPTAMAALIGKMMPLQINATATIDQTVTTKFSDVDIAGMTLVEKQAAFREMIGMTRALPPPEENKAPSSLRMIEGEAISEED
jgi:hypothetical protein